jgi:monoterpene epsilon-lactone hydrolase
MNDRSDLTRKLDAPKTVSEAARNALSGLPRLVPDYPDITDHAGWRMHIEQLNRQVQETFPAVETLQGIRTAAWKQVGGVHVVEAVPQSTSLAESKIVLDIHGGALIYLGGECVKFWACTRALQTGLRTISIDYRMAPDHPYPAALDDCLAVYSALVQDVGHQNIAVIGVSAGGNLAAALMLRARDIGLPMPAALVLLTPEVDLTESGDTFRTLAGLDRMDGLGPVNRLYAAGRPLDDPYVSPLFANLSGFPPTFLQSGTRDIFLSNTVLMHRKLRKANVAAHLHVWEAMPHGGFGGAPEDDELSAEMRLFLDERLCDPRS